MKQSLAFKYPNPLDPSQWHLLNRKEVLRKGFKSIWKGIMWLFKRFFK